MSELAIREVVKRYGDGDAGGAAVIDRVSLTVSGGEAIAIYGPSGSGKTTLLMIAAGLLEPDEGSVLFASSGSAQPGERGQTHTGCLSQGQVRSQGEVQDLAQMSARELALYRRRKLGFVFQAFHLVPGASALENAAMKLLSDGWTLNEAGAAARPWLERLGLASVAHKPSDRLSMGERQRVAIARALVNEPSLLLADEPTGNLDRQRGRQTLALLRDIAKEREIPLLLVTHDPEASAFVDRVHTLKDGVLTEGLDIDLSELAAR